MLHLHFFPLEPELCEARTFSALLMAVIPGSRCVLATRKVLVVFPGREGVFIIARDKDSVEASGEGGAGGETLAVGDGTRELGAWVPS